MSFGDDEYGTYSSKATIGNSSSMILSSMPEDVYTMTATTYTGSSLTEKPSDSYSDPDAPSLKGKQYLKMDDINAKWLVGIFVGNQ